MFTNGMRKEKDNGVREMISREIYFALVEENGSIDRDEKKPTVRFELEKVLVMKISEL